MVGWASKDAAEFYKQLGIIETDRMISMKGSVAQALYGRMRENVQKIALIKAVARDVPEGRVPAITWGDLQWASRVFERCMLDMEHALVENVADNEYQSDRNKLAKSHPAVSERDPRGATKSQIIRACQSIPARRRDEILEQMEEAGDVRKTVTAALVGRSSSTRYVWTFR
jgi:predicted metal-binding transcription factor (methanogenesis marker protein 9)